MPPLPDSFSEQHGLSTLQPWPGAERFLYLIPAKASVPPADEYYAVLSSDETQRANRFVRVEDRYRFVHCRARVRLILAQYLRCDAKDVALPEDEYGKPHLATSTLAINWSNSGDVALLGIGKSSAVGVDVELQRQFSDMDGIAESHFSPVELAYYHRSTNSAVKQDAFYRIWTLKESFIKLEGRGLSIPLTSFSMMDETGAIQTPDNNGVLWWGTPVAGYQAAAIFC